MQKKIVIIGAGSAMFTQGLIADLIRSADSFEWQLGLVDTDPIALDSISKLCRKMLDAKGANIGLAYSTDRRDVLPGADYVVTTIGVGGRRAWEQDVFIPRKYGVFQPVGDTVMPGGISRAMRMIPAMLEILKDVERICPKAFFFNYSNPMAIICRAMSRASSFPMVGLCHGVNHTEKFLADFAGVEREHLTTYAVGINHLTFMYDIRYKGEDLKPLLRKKLQEAKKTGSYPEPFSWEVFEAFDAFPAPGDRHITEFFTESFPRGEYYGKTLGRDAFSFEGTIAYGDTIYKKMTELAGTSDPLPEGFFDGITGEHEQLVDIIASIQKDSRKVFSVNVPNHGVVPNLPAHSALEMPGIATGKGFRALYAGDLPDVLAAILSKHLAIIEIVADAALKGDRRLFSEAVQLGGYMTDKSSVDKMVDELIKAQAEYLPQFK